MDPLQATPYQTYIQSLSTVCLTRSISSTDLEEYARFAPMIGVCSVTTWAGNYRVDALFFWKESADWKVDSRQFVMTQDTGGVLTPVASGNSYFKYGNLQSISPTRELIVTTLRDFVVQSHTSHSLDRKAIEVRVCYDVFTTKNIIRSYAMCDSLLDDILTTEHAAAVLAKVDRRVSKKVTVRLAKELASLAWSNTQFSPQQQIKAASLLDLTTLTCDAVRYMEVLINIDTFRIWNYVNLIVSGQRPSESTELETRCCTLNKTGEWLALI